LTNASFESLVKTILDKYKSTTLSNRWQEAISFGAGAQANAFWIRDSADVVNIVWLNSDGIRDITYLLTPVQTMFNFIPLKNITTFEVREAPEMASLYGLGVEGHMLVHLIVPSPYGHLYWVAHTDKEANNLKSFLNAVLTAYIETT